MGTRPAGVNAATTTAANGLKIRLACDNFAVAYEQVKAGKLRAVSITSPGPYPLAKEIEPTAATLPGFELRSPATKSAVVRRSGHLDPGTLAKERAGYARVIERLGVGRTWQFGPEYTKLFECGADFGDLADRDKLFNELLHDVGGMLAGPTQSNAGIQSLGRHA